MPPLTDLQFSNAVLEDLFTNHELLLREAARPAGPEEGGVRSVGIVGGGTAGWLTALALRKQLPWLEVSLIESSSIPVIGVGEASVPTFVSFLHHYLGLDVLEFTREVKPTWKQGIRFEWGLPGSYAFQAPFDWDRNGIGMLGSMAETGDVSSFTLQALLMARDVTPVIRTKGQLQSYLLSMPFAYHLDNPKLVAYLARTAKARGVRHVDATIVDAPRAEAKTGDGEPAVSHLLADDGQRLSFDLYVDCTGFRSLLLGKSLGTPFHSYTSSLFTDSAIAFNAPNGGDVKPYTTARTMENGWCWRIPMVDADHLGYVFSSAHCTDDVALEEARRTWPALSSERVVRFRSGRHERAWVGNVYALGNSYAFVEPLESTGLLMITRSITSLVREFPVSPERAVAKRFVNTTLGRDWDRLRWFLAVHYKYNRRLDTPFWRDARSGVDVSGLELALELFRTRGPLSILPRAIRASLTEATGIFFYGLAGLDTILLGQKVPYPKLSREPSHTWRTRRQLALEFTRRALPHAEALEVTWARPEWLQQLVEFPSGWVTELARYL